MQLKFGTQPIVSGTHNVPENAAVSVFRWKGETDPPECLFTFHRKTEIDPAPLRLRMPETRDGVLYINRNYYKAAQLQSCHAEFTHTDQYRDLLFKGVYFLVYKEKLSKTSE
jgi:hypothetical protein